MRGLVTDVNIQGHLPYLRRLLLDLDLWPILAELQIEFRSFADLRIPPDLDDRSLWNRCQEDGWVLLTENRNNDGEDSLHATLADSWRTGQLPVLTLANKAKFEHSRHYAERIARDIAELLFGIKLEEYRDQRRIFVPR